MSERTVDFEDLKLAWERLDQRLARHEALLLAGFTQRRLDAVRAGLRPLRWGQALQIPLGVVVMLLSAASWWWRWDMVNVRIAAMVMHAYGIALVVAGSRSLTLLERLDYAAPVVEIQRRLAELQRWYALSGLAHGMAWWLLWVPALVMLGGANGRDILARGPWVLGGYTAACVVGLAASLWLVWHAERSNRPAVRAWAKRSASGRSLYRAEAALAEIRQFECDDTPADR